MPGVSLELRMPSVSVVAGTMVAPIFVASNNSSHEVAVSSGVAVIRDSPDAAITPDAREFLVVSRTGPPGAFERRIPPGQTRELISTAQIPFDAGQAVHLRAGASLGVLQPNALFSSRVTSVHVDIPLGLTPGTPTDELKLELKTDAQQWCLRATDSHGAQPTGPLFLALTVRGTNVTTMTGDLPTATGDAWAMRWTQLGSPSIVDPGPAELTIWVGGPHYVTARVTATVASGP